MDNVRGCTRMLTLNPGETWALTTVPSGQSAWVLVSGFLTASQD